MRESCTVWLKRAPKKGMWVSKTTPWVSVCEDALSEYTEVPKHAREIRFVLQGEPHPEGVEVRPLGSAVEMLGFRDKSLDGWNDYLPLWICRWINASVDKGLRYLWIEWR